MGEAAEKKKTTFVHIHISKEALLLLHSRSVVSILCMLHWDVFFGGEGDGEMADYNIPSDVCWRLSVDQRKESDNTSVEQNSVPTFKKL